MRSYDSYEIIKFIITIVAILMPLSARAERIEITDPMTGYSRPYLVQEDIAPQDNRHSERITEELPREWYYFDTVATLPWYAITVADDFNHNGISEIYGWGEGFTYLDTITSLWNFSHIALGHQGVPFFSGDTDGDGLFELLLMGGSVYPFIDTGVYVFESINYYGYPENEIWCYPEDFVSSLDPKLGDLDSDGYGEVLFYNGNRAYGYHIFEYNGVDDYIFKGVINFWDYVHDYTGEPSWGDVDRDGRNEVFTGGIAGEIVIFENVADDSFEYVCSLQRRPNAYMSEYLGDTDNDGYNEFMITNGYFYTIFESYADNSYDSVFNINIPSAWFSVGDIITGDFTGLGQKEIALCSGINIAIIRAFGDNDWRVVLKYGNADIGLDIHKYPGLQLSNDFVINLVRGPEYMTRLLTPVGTFIPGDANASGVVNGQDIVYLLKYIRGEISSLARPTERGDTNGDCVINLSDITFLVNYCKGFGIAPEPGWCRFGLEY